MAEPDRAARGRFAYRSLSTDPSVRVVAFWGASTDKYESGGIKFGGLPAWRGAQLAGVISPFLFFVDAARDRAGRYTSLRGPYSVVQAGDRLVGTGLDIG
jgi:hypothetical protein